MNTNAKNSTPIPQLERKEMTMSCQRDLHTFLTFQEVVGQRCNHHSQQEEIRWEEAVVVAGHLVVQEEQHQGLADPAAEQLAVGSTDSRRRSSGNLHTQRRDLDPRNTEHMQHCSQSDFPLQGHRECLEAQE